MQLGRTTENIGNPLEEQVWRLFCPATLKSNFEFLGPFSFVHEPLFSEAPSNQS
jgi:hypothetical protein